MSKVMQYVIDAKQRILKTNKVCRGMYVNVACMNTRYTKTKANETVNNFFHLSQFSVWRLWEIICLRPFAVETIIAKAKPFEAVDLLRKDTRDEDKIRLALCWLKHINPHNANVDVIIAVQYVTDMINVWEVLSSNSLLIR